MTFDIPPLLPPDQTPPIRSVSDLDRLWRSIKGQWGFSIPQLWCSVFGPGGTVTPIVIKIDDCPARPDALLIGQLLDQLTGLVEEFFAGGSVALMYARPGGDEHREEDRQWARHLDEAGRRATIDVWPIFLANDVLVRIAAPDDLAA